MKKLIILDRDGVINQESRAYIKNPDEFIFIPQIPETLARLTKAGYIIAITTNQSGVARGYFSLNDLSNIHTKLREEVEALGGKIDQINFCPHMPDAGCHCRKPNPGMIENIEKEFDLKVSTLNPYLVGDSVCDMEMAIATGCKPCLVRTGDGLETYDLLSTKQKSQVFVYDSLVEVVDELLGKDN